MTGAEALAGLSTGLGWGAALLVAAAVPLLLIVATAYLKIAVVLALLRRALGVPEVPPNAALTALAVLLTVVAMAPVGQRVAAAVGPLPATDDTPALAAALARGAGPLRTFLRTHADDDELALFRDVAGVQGRPDAADDDLLVALPAFAVTELKEAFWAGFLLLLPFLVLELVAGAVLLATGLGAMSPAAASLPFKLLLFVVVDGWGLLARGLVLGYGP